MDATTGGNDVSADRELNSRSTMPLKRSTVIIVAALALLTVLAAGFLWKNKTHRSLDQASSVSINTKDLRNLGISLIDSTNPDFDSLTTSLIPAEARDNVQALRLTSAFLRNDTDHSLISYTIKWEMTTPDGKITTDIKDYLAPDTLMGRRTDDLAGVVRPHDIRFISQAPVVQATKQRGVSTGAGSGTSGGNTALQEYVNSLKTRAAAYTTITISVDAVLFDDGNFAGLNTTGRFEKIKAIIQAKRDLLSDFERNAGDGKSLQTAFDALNSIATEASPKLGPTSNTDDFYTFYRQRTARDMLALRDEFGDKEAAKRILAVLHRDWPELKRLT